MESQCKSIELGILNETDIFKIQDVTPICQCSLFYSSQNSPSINNAPTAQYQVLLQIRGEYVLQLDPVANTILSGFLCDYSINFQIMRSPPKAPMALGSPIQLQFTFTNNNNRKICLFAQDPDKLEIFGRRLQKKYVVQLGFKDCFKAIKILGKGMTATVYKASRFRDQTDVAIKSFKRSVYFANENGKLSFQKQFKILSLLHHKHVCFLQGVYETQNSTYIVMQNLALSLFGWIQKYGFPSFEDARKMMFHLLKGIEHLHSKGIMHRDLKLENIMVRRDSKENVEIVIVDMGLAEFTSTQKYLYTRCGTPGYVAPEILKVKSGENERYNQSCDVFSLGVIFHVLFFKKSLFQGQQVKEVIKKNTQCNINFSAEYFSTFCADGLDLIKRMLEKDPAKRITATEALNHQFNKPMNVSESVIKMDSTLQSINNIV